MHVCLIKYINDGPYFFVSMSVAISTYKCKNDLMPVFNLRSHVLIDNLFKFYYGVSFRQPKSQSSWYNIGKITVFIHDPFIPLRADITIQSFIRKNFIDEFILLVAFGCNPSKTFIENVFINWNFNTYFGILSAPRVQLSLDLPVHTFIKSLQAIAEGIIGWF